MQMREAEYSPAANARPALEHIHAAAALVAICGEIGIAEDAEFCHELARRRSAVSADVAPHRRVDASAGSGFVER